ncbi:MAG: thioredoxin [Planctomycetes bacterium]|nr:thioredoxin [Planctomycetota bacterium]
MASPNVLTFTDDNWQKEVVESSIPVVVDYGATWCAPCKLLNPLMDKVADAYVGKAKVGKLDIGESQETAVKEGVSGVPRVYIYKAGKPRRTFAGMVSEGELTKAIDEVLQEA